MEEIEVVPKIAKELVSILTEGGFFESKNDGMRLIKQGALYVTPSDRNDNATIFRCGHKFIEVIWKE